MRRVVFAMCVALMCACAPQSTPVDSAGSPVVSGQPSLATSDLPTAELGEWNGTKVISTHDITMPRVINFWASWCQACTEEFPLLANKEFAGQVVAINVKDISQSNSGLTIATNLVNQTDNAFPIYIDKNDSLLTSLGVSGLPLTIAVNAQHHIVDVEFGQLTHESLVRLITASES